MDSVSRARQLSLTIGVIAAVILALVLAIVWRRGGALEGMTDFLSRWFFAAFCTVYALAQLRVFVLRKKREARLAAEVPLSVFGFFMVLWFVLALAATFYGVRGGDGWWETFGWVTIVAVICVQLLVLGGLARRTDGT
jgi:hypothetical protein